MVLGVTATPSSINPAQTSTVQANLTYDSDGTYHNPAKGHVPDDILVSYSIPLGQGSVSPVSAGTVSGISQTLFTASMTGIVMVNATVDNQTVSTTHIPGGHRY